MPLVCKVNFTEKASVSDSRGKKHFQSISSPPLTPLLFCSATGFKAVHVAAASDGGSGLILYCFSGNATIWLNDPFYGRDVMLRKMGSFFKREREGSKCAMVFNTVCRVTTELLLLSLKIPAIA